MGYYALVGWPWHSTFFLKSFVGRVILVVTKKMSTQLVITSNKRKNVPLAEGIDALIRLYNLVRLLGLSWRCTVSRIIDSAITLLCNEHSKIPISNTLRVLVRQPTR